MKQYQCHKIVEAAPIVAAEFKADGSGQVWIADPKGGNLLVNVPPGFKRPNTEPGMNSDGGDYLVRYDGVYLSWSPKDVFEAGYSEVLASHVTADGGPSPASVAAVPAPDYRERVRMERRELADKLERLRAFNASDPRSDNLMRAQEEMMGGYLEILDKRISKFDDAPNQT